MKKNLRVLMTLILITAMLVEIRPVYTITGMDPSAKHSETYVEYGGETIILSEGESLQLKYTSASCTVTYPSECGWLKTEPKPKTKIQFRKFAATLGSKPIVVVAFGGMIVSSRRVMFNYPPASSAWHLPMGISQLTAILRQRGHEVIQRYGHLIGLEYILRKQGGGEIDVALGIVRDPTANIQSLYDARRTFERMSSGIQTADRFSVERNNVSYVSADYDGTIEGVVRAIQSRESNMWYEYFAKVEVPLAKDFNPHVYGISVGDERQFMQACILASMIKEELPNTLVVMGGNFWSRMDHAFNDPRFAVLFNYFDVISFKEGFQPIQKLVDTLDLKQTPGIVWVDGGMVVISPSPLIATPYEELPTAEYDGGADQWCPDRVLPLYTSSNCPTQCGFCAIAAGSDTFLKRPRVMTPTRIVDHMIQSGAHRFDVVDETFLIPRQLALGEELARRGYHATWQCYLTITNNLLDPTVAERLYAAGCRAVQLGLETLSPETLVREHKGWNSPKNYGAILQNFRKAGIQTHVFIIVGLPGEPLHSTLRWLPFFDEYGDSVLTIKSGRYRLTRMSPEAAKGTHSELIEVLPDTRPLHLNLDFRYKAASRKRVEAMRDLVEEVCRRHWAYGVTSTIPWWINRGRYTWEELEALSKQLPTDPPQSHVPRSLVKAGSIVRDELGSDAKFGSYEDLLAFAKTF